MPGVKGFSLEVVGVHLSQTGKEVVAKIKRILVCGILALGREFGIRAFSPVNLRSMPIKRATFPSMNALEFSHHSRLFVDGPIPRLWRHTARTSLLSTCAGPCCWPLRRCGRRQSTSACGEERMGPLAHSCRFWTTDTTCSETYPPGGLRRY